MLSFAELHQFLKLPHFFEHLEQHRKENKDITLLAFIQEHYVGVIEMDEDYQQDQQLPFREAGNFIATASIQCETIPAALDIEPPQPMAPQFSLFREHNQNLLHATDFFQPPRIYLL